MSLKNNHISSLIGKLKKHKNGLSFHYVVYTILFTIVAFSILQIVSATTPNPGHPWSELGDGVFVFSNSQTVTPYTYTFPAANTTVLTTNAAVTVAQGGTGLSSVASGSVFGANVANVLSAITSISGSKVLTNVDGTIAWGTAPNSMVYPASGIPNSTGSAWGTSYTVGTGASNLVQLNGSSQLPAVSGALLTSLAAGNLSGTIPLGVLGNSTLYVGTTAVALNRASANLALTGISSIAFPGAISGTATITPNSISGATALTLPNTSGTLALISDLTGGYVPYTGATSNVDLGIYSLATPKVIGGTGTTSPLTFQTTSGVGTTGADMHFKVGNNGATEAMTILNSGAVDIGSYLNFTGVVPYPLSHINSPSIYNYDSDLYLHSAFAEGLGESKSIKLVTTSMNYPGYNTSSRLTVKDRYVGIGTDNPTSALEVVGDIASKGLDWKNLLYDHPIDPYSFICF